MRQLAIGALLLTLSTLQAEHTGNGAGSSGARAEKAKGNIDQLLSLLERKLQNGEPLQVRVNRDAVPDESRVPANAKSIEWDEEKTQVLRIRLLQIKEYLEKIRKFCGSAEEVDAVSVPLAAYVENFLANVASGIQGTGDQEMLIVSPMRLARFAGGITHFLNLEKPSGEYTYPRFEDTDLLAHSRDLYSLFSDTSDGDPGDTLEKPLKDAIEAFIETPAKPCKFGDKESTTSSYDVKTRTVFDPEKSKVTSGDGKRSERNLEIKAGEKFTITLAIKDLKGGFHEKQDTTAYLYGADPSLETTKLTYNKSAGTVTLEFETNPFIGGGRYDALNFNYKDASGESQYANLPKIVSVVVRPNTPDTTPPVLHVDRAEVRVDGKAIKGPPYDVKIGDKIEYVIPISDDASGFDGRYTNSNLTPPINTAEGEENSSHSGAYDPKRKALVYPMIFKSNAPFSEHTVSNFPYITDNAGNDADRSVQNRQVTFRVTNPRTDYTPPEIDVASFRWEEKPTPGKEIRPKKRTEGVEVSIVVSDLDSPIKKTELRGVDTSNRTRVFGVEGSPVDPKTGRTTFRVGANPGRYRITEIVVTDEAGNERRTPIEDRTVVYQPPYLPDNLRVLPKPK